MIALLICIPSSAQIPPTGIQDEGGTEIKPVFTIDCVGAGISCSHSGTTGTITVAGGGSATITVQEGDVTVSSAVDTIDWQSCFDITESPTGEVNVTFDSSECTINADALKANGANCASGNYPLGVDASGAVESCTADDAGTDDQTIDIFSFSSPNISLSLEDDGEATKTLDISAVDTDTNLTQEEVEDFAGALVTDGTGTHTGIAVTYQDATGDVDMVVDHDGGSNFDANEHFLQSAISITESQISDLSHTTDTFADVEVDGVDVATNAVTLDFDGTDFSVTESPADDFDVTIDDDGHLHTGSSISGVDISDDTNLAVTAPIVLTDDTVSVTQNAGTDITADLEEESHCSEHASTDVSCSGETILVTDDQHNHTGATIGSIDISDDTNLTADDGIDLTGDELDVVPLAAGADADSSTTSSDSGLEIVSDELTIIRGCNNNQGLKWDETNDEWDCGRFGLIIAQAGDAYVDTQAISNVLSFGISGSDVMTLDDDYIDIEGRLAVGDFGTAVDTGIRVKVFDTDSDGTSQIEGVQTQVQVTNVAKSGEIIAVNGTAISSGSGASTAGITGGIFTARQQASGLATEVLALEARPQCLSTSDITTAIGIDVLPTHGAAPSSDCDITTFYGLRIQDFDTQGSGGGAITNYYGVYQEDATATNYFAGNVGIGTTSPSTALDVNGTITGVNVTSGTDPGHTHTAGGTSIADSDSDTKVDVEESADEDTIRFDTAGTERMTIGSTGLVNITSDLTGSTSALRINESSIDLQAAGPLMGIEQSYTISSTVDTFNDITMEDLSATILNGSFGVGDVIAHNSSITYSSTDTADFLGGSNITIGASGSGAVDNIIGSQVDVSSNSGGSVANIYGSIIKTDGAGGVSTLIRELWLDGGFTGTGSPTMHSIYQDDASYDNYLEGDLVIGADAPLARFSIDGDTDVIQAIIQANSTQTNNLLVMEDSSGTDMTAFNHLGYLGLDGTAPATNTLISVNSSGSLRGAMNFTYEYTGGAIGSNFISSVLLSTAQAATTSIQGDLEINVDASSDQLSLNVANFDLGFDSALTLTGTEDYIIDGLEISHTNGTGSGSAAGNDFKIRGIFINDMKDIAGSGTNTQWGINSLEDIQITSDKDLVLEGDATTKGDTTIHYDSSDTDIEITVDGTEVFNIDDDQVTSSVPIETESCPILTSTFWAEESAALSTGTSGGLQFSFGNGNIGANGITQPCAGTVVMMALSCENDTAASTGVVQIAKNGVAQGSGCQVSTPNSGDDGAYDNTCAISFAIDDEITAITTTSDSTANGCTATWWVQYD